jgi:hypothetical protein
MRLCSENGGEVWLWVFVGAGAFGTKAEKGKCIEVDGVLNG